MTTKPTHTEIQPHMFLDRGGFTTKSGDVGIVLQLTPQDSECMEPEEVAAIARRFESAMRLLDSQYRVYQYLLKRRINTTQYAFDTYIVIMRMGLHGSALRAAADAVCTQLGSEIPAKIASKEIAFQFLRSLLNYDPALASIVGLKYDEYIAYYAADAQIEVHGAHLMVGDRYVRALTLKDPPQATTPDMLRTLREIPCECIVVTEWKPVDAQEIRTLLHKKTSHFHVAKYATNWAGALMAKFSTNEQKERPEHMQKDQSASAMEAQLGELAEDIEKNGTQVGEFALTVIVFDTDEAKASEAASEVVTALSRKEGTVYHERLNLLGAWFAALPGGCKHQRRSQYLTNHNYADMSLLFGPSTGNKRNAHLNAGCLAVLETRQATPFYANLHYEDVGHALISGMTGSGKSYLCNYLLRGAVREYGARVVIFDIGGSYKQVTGEMGGSYMEIGLKHEFTINPFSLPPTEENRHFLFAFVKVLIEAGEYRMNDLDEEPLYRAIPGTARLGDLRDKLPEHLQPYLDRWTGNGRYANLFDNELDTLTCAKFQAFDFEGLEKYPRILEPLLFYVLHRANADVYDNAARDLFKIFLLDEAWRFLLNPTVKAYIHESLKTWRKRNAAMWLATQSIGDLEQAAMLRTVAENCGSLVLLPNPRMDREEYKQIFKLNETELDMVQTMASKRESLWKPAVGPSKVLILDVEKERL